MGSEAIAAVFSRQAGEDLSQTVDKDVHGAAAAAAGSVQAISSKCNLGRRATLPGPPPNSASSQSSGSFCSCCFELACGSGLAHSPTPTLCCHLGWCCCTADGSGRLLRLLDSFTLHEPGRPHLLVPVEALRDRDTGTVVASGEVVQPAPSGPILPAGAVRGQPCTASYLCFPFVPTPMPGRACPLQPMLSPHDPPSQQWRVVCLPVALSASVRVHPYDLSLIHI